MKFRTKSLLIAVFAAYVGFAAPQVAFASETAGTAGVLITLDQSALAGSGSGASLLSDDAEVAGTVSELQELGISVTDADQTADGSVILTAVADGLSDVEAAEAAAQVEGVASAQPNYMYYLLDDESSSSNSGVEALLASLGLNDPFTAVSDTSSSTQNQYWAYLTGLVEAWAEASEDVARAQVTIAVLDTGVRFDHEDLQDNLLVDLAWDATKSCLLTQSSTTGDDDAEGIGHGTHVAGIAAATSNNGVGLVGASLGANILPIKVFAYESNRDGSASYVATSASLVRAYNYIFNLIDEGKVEGLRVVNMSLGGYEKDDMNDRALESAIETARSTYRILSVCAGGNGHGTLAAAQADGSDEYIYPGDFEACLCVTALTLNGTTRSDSEYNDAKDLSTYGTYIWSTYNSSSNSYVTMGGTSMATPIVSGTAALLFSVYPNATVDQVVRALISTATKVEDQPALSGSAGALDADAALEACSPFADVGENEWYLESVQYVEKKGLMNGYYSSEGATGNFGPTDGITRGQLALVLYRYLGNNAVYSWCGKPDVVQGAYYDAINWAVATGVMQGYGDSGYFGTEDPLTREQLAKVFATLMASEDQISASDLAKFYTMLDWQSTSDWAVEYVAWALNNSILTGVWTTKGYYVNGSANSSRAEVATLFMRSIESGLL